MSPELVSGDCYISDESSFYGDEDQKQRLEDLVADTDMKAYFSTCQPSLTAIAHQGARIEPRVDTVERSKTAYNPYEGVTSARQLDEPLSTFLSRCPPATFPKSLATPWIWIAYPYSPVRETDADYAGYKAVATAILNRLTEAKISLTDSLSKNGKPPSKALFSKKYKPVRQQAESDMLAAAKKHGVTSGKWMLFPTLEEVNRVWSRVAEGVLTGELGNAAKVAPDDGDRSARAQRVVCVYTRDFGDKADVKRVLKGLVERDLVPKRGEMGQRWGIYYKCDALTHMGLNRGNEWDISPSLYSSVDMLDEWMSAGLVELTTG